MANASNDIYDLYVTNVQKVEDIRTTSVEFEKFINRSLIKHQLEEFLGLVKLIKIPAKSKYHTGETYQIFLRLERTNNHIGAAEILDNLKFRGRPISVKINNLPSNKSQWLAANDEYKNINLHSEKVKLIRHLTEQANKNHPNQEIGQLKNEIEAKNEQIESLNLNLELANSKIFQLNNRLSKIQLESNSKDEERLKLIKNQSERIEFLEAQFKMPKLKLELRPYPTGANIQDLEIMLLAKDKQIQSLEEALKREIGYKTKQKKEKNDHSEFDENNLI